MIALSLLRRSAMAPAFRAMVPAASATTATALTTLGGAAPWRRGMSSGSPAPHTPSAPVTTYAGELEDWVGEFLKAISGVPKATDPYQSSEILRELVKTKLLRFEDMRDAPEKFFMAHRLLSTVGLSGFGIRFTVQFNLFAGSLVGLAGPEQLKMLPKIQEKGQLGCFLLTEMQVTKKRDEATKCARHKEERDTLSAMLLHQSLCVWGGV